jgi:nitrogen fixation NifU-like protein
VILDHNKSPRNYRAIENPSSSVEGFNPLCGDHYTVYVKLDGDTVADIGFTGNGCAISKASASVMSSIIKGKTAAEAGRIFADFQRLVRGELSPDKLEGDTSKLAAFAGVSEFPARVKCASLAWHTLQAALKGKTTSVTME